METVIDFFLNWLVLPLIIIYGFVSWSKEHPDTKFMINPDEVTPEEKKSDKQSRKKD